jgi:uncharacterized protein (DUF1684 family)
MTQLGRQADHLTARQEEKQRERGAMSLSASKLITQRCLKKKTVGAPDDAS